MTTRSRLTALALLALAALGSPALAQTRWDLRGGVPVGSEEERYLRLLQLTGAVPTRPWTIRSASIAGSELQPTSGDHPWQGRFRPTDPLSGSAYAGVVRPEVRGLYNSAFPFGENDGPLWAGRGLTTATAFGAFARLGPLELRLAPSLFVTENRGYGLVANGYPGDARLRDGKYPTQIDNPQRFGEDAYGRLDPGQSYAALRLWPVRIGVSTGSQQWGAATNYPLLLGNNAGGFEHLFLETTDGLGLWLFDLHVRAVVARLRQSDVSPVQSGERRRLASAVVFALEPRGAQGLELGGGRFVASPWPEGGIDLDHLKRPFSGIFTFQRRDVQTNVLFENQLAVAFVRWAPPGGGIELYAEFLKDDFGRDVRQYIMDPDDLSGRVFGVQKVVSLSDGRLLVLRGEAVSAELQHTERGDRVLRDPVLHPWSRYRHDEVAQGHTQRGQILGSPTAYGGAGLTLGADLYHRRGRWTVEILRMHRLDWYPGYDPEGERVVDVLWGLRLDMLLFLGGWDLGLSATPAWNLNRNLDDSGDVFNLNLGLRLSGVRW